MEFFDRPGLGKRDGTRLGVCRKQGYAFAARLADGPIGGCTDPARRRTAGNGSESVFRDHPRGTVVEPNGAARRIADTLSAVSGCLICRHFVGQLEFPQPAGDLQEAFLAERNCSGGLHLVQVDFRWRRQRLGFLGIPEFQLPCVRPLHLAVPLSTPFSYDLYLRIAVWQG